MSPWNKLLLSYSLPLPPNTFKSKDPEVERIPFFEKFHVVSCDISAFTIVESTKLALQFRRFNSFSFLFRVIKTCIPGPLFWERNWNRAWNIVLPFFLARGRPFFDGTLDALGHFSRQSSVIPALRKAYLFCEKWQSAFRTTTSATSLYLVNVTSCFSHSYANTTVLRCFVVSLSMRSRRPLTDFVLPRFLTTHVRNAVRPMRADTLWGTLSSNEGSLERPTYKLEGENKWVPDCQRQMIN